MPRKPLLDAKGRADLQRRWRERDTVERLAAEFNVSVSVMERALFGKIKRPRFTYDEKMQLRERWRNRLTRKKLAREIGGSPETVRKILNGSRYKPDPADIDELAGDFISCETYLNSSVNKMVSRGTCRRAAHE